MFIAWAAALVLAAATRAETPVASPAAVAASKPLAAESFLDHVRFLASDELEGRGSGSAGNDKAADYIARQFKEAGLTSAGDGGSFFQKFQVQLQPTLGEGSKLVFDGGEKEGAKPFEVGTDFMPFPFSASTPFAGEVVFAGYGIQNPEKDRDDYVHVDANGKVVLMLRGEPANWADSNGEATPHAALTTKTFVARQHGAVAVLIVNVKPADGGADELYAWPPMLDGALGADCGLPAFHISRRVAEMLIGSNGVTDALVKVQESLDGGAYASRPLPGRRAEGNATIVRATRDTRNVVGLLKADGPGADEYLVMGAHFDHLGIAVPRTTFGKKADAGDAVKPQIHNGADDNASGAAGIIELARAFKAGGPWPRSILFVTFSGEEIGLLGSKFFVEHPPVPVEKMVAMINLDMIGRLPENHMVQVFGTEAAEEFKEMLPRLAEAHKLGFRGSGSAFGPSDHTSFYTQKVPAMHFFTGLHSDYHLPSDDTDKINAAGAAEVLAYVFDVGAELAKSKDRP
jgi:hypothetical protein